MSERSQEIQTEFGRAAAGFAERTRGRFNDMGVVEFSRLRPGATVAEIGAGTGNFLALFGDVAGRLIAVDITPRMLAEARARHDGLELVVGDGAHLPLGSGSIDLVASAQTFHHIPEPVPVLEEMRRAASRDGRVLIVDQVAPERYEEAAAMFELEALRDPTHAASRPASAFRIMVAKAGLEVVDERIVEGTSRFSSWMWPGEFPDERIAAVQAFVERHGERTGMDWRRDGNDWSFTRRRIMLLAA